MKIDFTALKVHSLLSDLKDYLVHTFSCYNEDPQRCGITEKEFKELDLSQKFLIPDLKSVPRIERHGTVFCKLPAQKCLIQVSCTWQDLIGYKFSNIKNPEIVMEAHNYTTPIDVVWFLAAADSNDQSEFFEYKKIFKEVFFIATLFFRYAKTNQMWATFSSFCIVGEYHDGTVGVRTADHLSNRKTTGNIKPDVSLYILTTSIERGILDFLHLLHCKNIEQKIIKPPLPLNKKRKERGNLPFYSYKILDLRNNLKQESIYTNIGTHASPRYHFRRGHIRRLSEDNLIWVKECMVGDINKGIVEKHYVE